MLEGETADEFEVRIVVPLRLATARMKHAKAIMPKLTAVLTGFHDKVPSPLAMGRAREQRGAGGSLARAPAASIQAPRSGNPPRPRAHVRRARRRRRRRR